jgi:hypothetical protein
MEGIEPWEEKRKLEIRNWKLAHEMWILGTNFKFPISVLALAQSLNSLPEDNPQAYQFKMSQWSQP